MNNKKYETFSYTDLFISFGPLPKSLNLLDKYEFIQYNGLKIPRIPLNSNNSIDFQEIINGRIIKENSNKVKNNEKCPQEEDKVQDDHTVLDNNYIKYSKLKNNYNIDLFNYKQNNNFVFDYKKYLFIKKNNFNNKIIQKSQIINNNFEKKEKSVFIPPKKIISIFNHPNNKKYDFSMNNTDYYNDINNIIINNINNIYLFIKNLYIEKIRLNSIYKNPTNFNNNNKELVINPIYPLINIKSNSYQNQNFFFSKNMPLFQQNQIMKPFKRRRKEKRKNKKIHTASDDDNILRKIQVHFLSFVTNYINDIIKKFISDKKVPLFKNIDYKIKKLVNHKFIEELKSKNIAELLQLRPSPKMKIHDEYVNKNIYNKICLICPFMKEYLQQSYLSLFKEYYTNNNRIFIVNGQLIPLSSRTKTFSDLISKNYAYKEKIKYIVINYFLNKYKRLKKPNFKINVINKNKNKEKKKKDK